LPDGSGKLIGLDWSSDIPKRFQNLVRVDSASDEIWKAELPHGSSPDGFTDARLDGNAVRAKHLELLVGYGRSGDWKDSER